MEEATTSDTGVEATSEEISTTSDETAGRTEVEQTETKVDVSSSLDLKDVPEEARGYVSKYVNEHADREFKKYLTKYTQERSAETKQRDLEFQTTKQQLDQLNQTIQSALQDPKVYEQYRRQLGLVQDEQEPEKPIETLEDLQHYLKAQKNEIAEVKRLAEQKAAQTSREQITQYDKDQRYISSKQRVASEIPVFGKYEDLVLSHMQKNFMGRYTGNNEYEVMKAAAEDFNRILKQESEQERQALLASQKLKKSAATIAPQKKVAIKSGQGQDMREDVIAAVRRRLGEI
jgi:hypothetical protein